MKNIIIYAVVFIVAYSVFKLICPFVFVVGDSMVPTLTSGELLMKTNAKDINRGDIIVLKDPENQSHKLIKRVIGMPGEKVKITKGKVYINNILLDEPLIEKVTCTVTGESEKWSVKAGEYFVLGDNRDNSKDSRIFGAVKKDLIIGGIKYIKNHDNA